MVVPVVVEVDDAVQLRLHVDVEVLWVLDALAEGLPGVLLHLNVVKFPARENRSLVVDDDGGVFREVVYLRETLSGRGRGSTRKSDPKIICISIIRRR